MAVHVKYFYPPQKACMDEIRIISAQSEIYFTRTIVQSEYPGPVKDEDRNFYLSRNGWSYSPKYYYYPISARDLFETEGGRSYFGFGSTSGHWNQSATGRGKRQDNLEMSRRQLLLPWVFPVLVLLVLPTILVRSLVEGWLKRRRTSQNLCVACGYDLRASPHRCPECGTMRISGVP
jgi:hypothetical protein